MVRNCEGSLHNRLIRGFMGDGHGQSASSQQPVSSSASQPTPSSDSLVTLLLRPSNREDAESRRRPAPAKIGNLSSLEALTDGEALLIQASK